MLETIDLTKRFAGIVATNNVSLQIAKGARHALIGPNGAGKTTLINLLTGVRGRRAAASCSTAKTSAIFPTHKRVRLGIVRTFQINQLFGDLTPLETIGLAVSERRGQGLDWWRSRRQPTGPGDGSRRNSGAFPPHRCHDKRTAVLPYGKQRLLEIAVAIACRPRVLLLDEPAAGVPEDERHEILAAVAALPSDVTVLLIEHDMDIVFSFADRISVLVNGALFVEGTPKKLPAIPASKPSISARSRSMPDLLNVERLTAGYGEAVVLTDVSFKIAEGQALALLGRNGMGKTTLVNSIVGVTRHIGGSISLDGHDITGMRPDQRAHAGIGWVPQERNIFRSLTVEENMTAIERPGPWTLAKVYALISAPRRAPSQSWQSAVRRRAADARRRPRARPQSAHHAAR